MDNSAGPWAQTCQELCCTCPCGLHGGGAAGSLPSLASCWSSDQAHTVQGMGMGSGLEDYKKPPLDGHSKQATLAATGAGAERGQTSLNALSAAGARQVLAAMQGSSQVRLLPAHFRERHGCAHNGAGIAAWQVQL